MMTTTQKASIALLITISVLILLSCSKVPQETGYSIYGKIHGVPDGTKIILYDTKQAINIDSAITNNETFVLSGFIEQPTDCILKNAKIGEQAKFIVENTKIEFESPLKDMYSKRKVIGGYEHALSEKLLAQTSPNAKEYGVISDTLQAELYKDRNHRNTLIMRHRKLLKKEKAIIDAFILKNPNSYFTLNLLYRNRKRINRDSLIVTLDKLEEKYRTSLDAKYLDGFISGEEVELKKGDQIADFTALTLEDSPFTLSSLKGNYIYLSFWSMGCGPCRKENRIFSELFDSLQADFRIVSFSVDRSKEMWKKASGMDGIKWANISDLEGKRGEIAMTYSVQALPISYLIDKDGLIIEKYTGFSDDSIDKIMAAISSD